ncbi:hypothetical protein DB30_05378 [Enhygromyxa salina]|uniref:Uncharacterized protein n=1 Tax=Enhygromyxa salina TaxID=215803 RepID=A0A0C2D1D8_9BACT|nr:hypothetical protein [Enhygromyxa salina]KIG15630.1 hypothetical protein DB30_05378 [Enhygromyxa salina]
MIRIKRGSEADLCPALAEVRDRELERVRPEIARGVEPIADILMREYKIARQALASAQYHKCCYCEERQQSVSWKHVEHFRPKRAY